MPPAASCSARRPRGREATPQPLCWPPARTSTPAAHQGDAPGHHPRGPGCARGHGHRGRGRRSGPARRGHQPVPLRRPQARARPRTCGHERAPASTLAYVANPDPDVTVLWRHSRGHPRQSCWTPSGEGSRPGLHPPKTDRDKSSFVLAEFRAQTERIEPTPPALSPLPSAPPPPKWPPRAPS
ncbi:hypothetical protein QJS66_03730 [Kocuria rhizophila]|nr:hypothetical protein QJS66_03730 [Kocuria rhizophila]